MTFGCVCFPPSRLLGWTCFPCRVAVCSFRQRFSGRDNLLCLASCKQAYRKLVAGVQKVVLENYTDSLKVSWHRVYNQQPCAALGRCRMKIVTVNDMFAGFHVSHEEPSRVTCSSVECCPLALLSFKSTSARLVNDLPAQSRSHTHCTHIGVLPALWLHPTFGQRMLKVRCQLVSRRRRWSAQPMRLS